MRNVFILLFSMLMLFWAGVSAQSKCGESKKACQYTINNEKEDVVAETVEDVEHPDQDDVEYQDDDENDD